MVFIAVANAALLAALLLVPALGGAFLAWQIGLFLLYGVAAQGVGFAWGKGGFLPLGNALFFGIGAYGAAMALNATDGALWINLLAMLGLAALCAGLAFGLAVLLFRGRADSGPGFSLVTLALVLIAAQIAETTPALTGGFNGYAGYAPIAGLDPFSGLYYAIVALVILVTAGLMVLEKLPAGLILRALTAQEGRLQLLGFASFRVKAWAYAVSAGVAALAGTLYASHQGIVTPQAIGFLLSAELVIWAAVGGRMHPMGPLLGAVAIGWASAGLRDTVVWWEVVVAAAFLLVVLTLPGGAVDLVARLGKRLGWSPRTARPAPRSAPPSRAAHAEGALKLDDIAVSAGSVHILNGLTLEVPETGVVCVIGPNGAGKTTLLNAVTGRMKLRAGRVGLGENDITHQAPHRMLGHGIGRKMQVPTVFNGLSVAENLQLAVLAGRARWPDLLRPSSLGWSAASLDRVLAHPDVTLNAAMTEDAGQLPQGHRQILELAMTLASDPRLVLLDEPAAGMSPTETAVMVDLIRSYQAATGASILIIEHDMALVEALASDVIVLHQGQVLARGTLAEMRADPKVSAVYQGGHK